MINCNFMIVRIIIFERFVLDVEEAGDLKVTMSIDIEVMKFHQ